MNNLAELIERADKWLQYRDSVGSNTRITVASVGELVKAMRDHISSMGEPLDPDMPVQKLRLHMGELTASEVRVARAVIAWANLIQQPGV